MLIPLGPLNEKRPPYIKEAVFSLALIIKPNKFDVEKVTCQDIIRFSFIEQNIIGADSQQDSRAIHQCVRPD